MDYESVLLVKHDVMVYKIPHRQSNRDYRANDWDLDNPSWTGRLRMITRGNELTLKLENATTGQLYAKCPIEEQRSVAVESVSDSSRYFVIRLKSDDGQVAFAGIGFKDRTDSFDFNVCIQDHFKQIKQEAEALTKQSNEPSLDLSFKQGEKIKLNLNTRRTGDDPTSKSKPAIRLGAVSSSGILPPPPPPASSRSRGGRGTLNSTSNQTEATEKTNDMITKPPIQTSNVDTLVDFFG